MPVAVHRPELDRLRMALSNALFGFVSGLLRRFVDALFAPYLDGLQARLNDLLDAHGRGAAVLVFHDKVPPTPSPSASPSSSSSCGVSLPAGTYTGTYTLTQTVTTGAAVAHYDEAGSVTLTVAADGTLRGTWGATGHRTYDLSSGGIKDHLESTFVLTDGMLTGTICNLVAGQPKETIVSCIDSKFGDCRGTAGTFQVTGAGLPFGRPTAGASGSFIWQVTDTEPSAEVIGFVRIIVSGQ